MIEIKQVKTPGELKQFIDFPNRLYRGNPYFVPAMRMDELGTLQAGKNPAFEFCEAAYYLALKDGKIVGRVGAIINRRANETLGEKRARFTRLDFIDDPEVSAALLAKVESWARERDMEEVHGPMGFSDMDQEGMLVEGFDELSTMITLYNHAYYKEHLDRLGYRKDIDWIEYQFEAPRQPNEKLHRLSQTIMKRYDFQLLEFKRSSDILPYAKELFRLYNDAYKDLYGFAALTPAQVDSYIKQYFGFINPAFVKVVLDAEGRMAAFGISLPSLSRALQRCGGRLFPLGWAYLLRAIHKNDRLDLCLIGVRPDLQNLGVNAIMIDAVTQAAIRSGIRIVESNPELETNIKVQAQWKYYERRQHRRRRCFIKTLKQ